MFEIIRRTMIMNPCATESCHASTNLKCPDGRVLAAWFGGTAEGKRDVAIYLAEGQDGRFSPPIRFKDSDQPHWNPVLFALDADTIALFYKVGFEIATWRTYVRISRGGSPFSAPRELVPGDEGGRGPVRSKPIRLSNGAILAPASREDGPWRAFFDTSSDGGECWTRTSDIGIPSLSGAPRRGVIQPTLWESAPGRVHALMRSSEGFIYRTDAVDGAFSEAYKTDLPNNNSGIDLVKLEGGALLMAHNPVPENWGKRTPLTLSISRDNGATFEKLIDLETSDGEYSYPAITLEGGRAYITYTHNRENIAYVELSVRN